MTNRLYYHDTRILEFSATIQDVLRDDRGINVYLDQTSFYPTSGGQPHDTGTIAGIPVIDVWEDEDGKIWHLLEDHPPSEQVIGLIDWDRRFDHMQQHTGQHVLSAIFLEEKYANTVGFHIGSLASTIDLDSTIARDDFLQIEAIANRIVWENRPVTIHFLSENEIDGIPFRKPPQVSGIIRVIWIKDFDVSACGGTHVRQTGEIGLIKIISGERYKSGTRIAFLCGFRALHDYQKIQDNIQRVSASLSIHPDDLPDTIARFQEEISINRQAYSKTRKELLRYEADSIWNKAPAIDGIKRIYTHWETYSVDDLKTLALHLRQFPKTLILLASTAGESTRLICARSQDLGELDVNSILNKALTILGGRGGGSPEMANGGAPWADQQAVLRALHNAIQHLNSVGPQA